MRLQIKKAGFTLVEVLVALSIFIVVIVGGNTLLSYLGDGLIDSQGLIQTEYLARNGLIISKEILKEEDTISFNARLAYMSGNPKEGYFALDFDGTNYSLLNQNIFEGPINLYSEAESGSNTTKFYRKIYLKQTETWGLYELAVETCFDNCETTTSLSTVFKRS